MTETAQTHLLNQALSHFKAGRHVSAVPLLEKVLNIDPSQPDASHILGLIKFASGALREAQALVQAAIESRPNTSIYYNNLALILRAQGALEDAETAASEACTLAPGDAQAHTTHGVILQSQKRYEEAEAAYLCAINIRPDYVQAHVNLGLLALESNDFDSARQAFLNARQIFPPTTDIIAGYARSLLGLGRAQDAIAYIESEVNQENGNTRLDILRAEAYLRDNKPRKAHDLLKVLQNQNPASALILNNLGFTLRDLGLHHDAKVALQEALLLEPDFDDAADNLAQLLLSLGHFSDAWPLYRRRKTQKRQANSLAQNGRWGLEADISMSSIVAWTEQGLGDEILQASLISDLKNLAADLTVICSKRVKALFEISFPNVTFTSEASLQKNNAVGSEFVRAPLLDFGGSLRSQLQDFPAKKGYLKVPVETVKGLRTRYARSTNPKNGYPLLIGISWQSGHVLYGDRNTIPIERWRPIFEAAKSLERPVVFVSTQYGATADFVEQVSRSLDIPLLFDPAIDQAGALLDAASQIAAFDLVISTSTTSVQLAGALGRPVWHMTSAGVSCGWYWMAHGEGTPWYPSMRLFRRERFESADRQIDRVAESLAETYSG